MEQKRFIKNVLSTKINTDRKISNFKRYVGLGIYKKYLNFSESYNDKIGKVPFNDNFFSYSYQRHDLKIDCNHWLKFLYNIDIDRQSAGLFFTSCMASISVLFMILKKYNYNRIVFSNLPYFESYDFAEKLFSQENIKEFKNLTEKSIDVLYICSASPTFLSIDYTKINTKCIVFDSSCVDCSSDYIKQLVNYCCKNNIKLFLVRSHMKLDCFGLEINRLGSLVFLNCDKNFIDGCNELSIYFGNKAPLKDIYLWFGEQKFFEITTKNINKVLKLTQYSSNLLTKLLDSNKFEVINFDNGIYFVIKLKKRVDNLDKLNRDTTTYCKKFDLPIITTASFYLEQVGFDNFSRRLDNNNQFLRISLSTYISKKDTTEIIKKIAEYLNNVDL